MNVDGRSDREDEIVGLVPDRDHCRISTIEPRGYGASLRTMQASVMPKAYKSLENENFGGSSNNSGAMNGSVPANSYFAESSVLSMASPRSANLTRESPSLPQAIRRFDVPMQNLCCVECLQG